MKVKIFDYYGEEYIIVQEFAEEFYAVGLDLEIEKFPIEHLWESSRELEYEEMTDRGKDKVIEAIHTWNQFIK